MPRQDNQDDPLTLTLFVLARFGQMPDLLDFFGFDARKFLAFIDRFGGMTLKLPDREEIGRMARNMNIYRRLRSKRSKQTLVELGRTYGISSQRVAQLYHETMREVRQLDERSGDDTDTLLQGSDVSGVGGMGT